MISSGQTNFGGQLDPALQCDRSGIAFGFWQDFRLRMGPDDFLVVFNVYYITHPIILPRNKHYITKSHILSYS
jgi:hypothetical protein